MISSRLEGLAENGGRRSSRAAWRRLRRAGRGRGAARGPTRVGLRGRLLCPHATLDRDAPTPAWRQRRADEMIMLRGLAVGGAVVVTARWGHEC